MLCPRSGPRRTREVVGVVSRAELWRAIIATACSKRIAVERCHLPPRGRPKGDVDRRLGRLTFDDKELDILASKIYAACLCRTPRELRPFIRSGASARSYKALLRPRLLTVRMASSIMPLPSRGGSIHNQQPPRLCSARVCPRSGSAANIADMPASVEAGQEARQGYGCVRCENLDHCSGDVIGRTIARVP